MNKIKLAKFVSGGALSICRNLAIAASMLLMFISSVYSQSSTNHLELSGQYGGGCLTVALKNNLLLTGEGPNLVILDASNLTNPTVISRLRLSCMVEDIKIENNIAYIACREGGLAIVNIVNPSSPKILSFSKEPKFARRVAVSNKIVYVADYFSGIKIIDCANPQAPELLCKYNTGAVAQDICVVGNTAYIANDNLGLMIVDISIPSIPAKLSSYTTSDNACGLYVKDSYAYVAASAKGLEIIDVSNSSNPVYKGKYLTGSMAQDVFVTNNTAYITASANGTAILNVSNVSSPVYLGKVTTNNKAWTCIVENNIAYIPNFNSGLQIADVTSPGNPVSIYNYVTHGFSQNVYADGNLLFLADGSNGAAIFNIENPAAPVELSSIKNITSAYDVFSKNNYMYIAAGAQGLYSYNISVPSNPVCLSLYNTSGTCRKVKIKDNYAYAADSEYGVVVLDISDPQNISLKGSYNTNGFSYDLDFKDDYCYIADGTAGLVIINVSNPATPQLVGSLDTSVEARSICISGQYAYVADGSGGVKIIDISDPAAPFLEKTIFTTNSSQAVTLLDNNLYIAESGYYYASKMEVYDMTSIQSPVLKDSYFNPGIGSGLYSNGENVFLAHDFGGAFIFKYHQTALPTPTPIPYTAVQVEYEDFESQNDWKLWDYNQETTETLSIWTNDFIQYDLKNIPLPAPGFFQWLRWDEQSKNLDYNIPIDDESIFLLKATMHCQLTSGNTAPPKIRLRMHSRDNSWISCGLFGGDDINSPSGGIITQTPSDFFLICQPQGSNSGIFYSMDIYDSLVNPAQNRGELFIDEVSIYRAGLPSLEKTVYTETNFNAWSASNESIVLTSDTLTINNQEYFSYAGKYITLDEPTQKNNFYRIKYSLSKTDDNDICDQIRLRANDIKNDSYSTNLVFNDKYASSQHLSIEPKEYSLYYLSMNDSSKDPAGDLAVSLDLINMGHGNSPVVLSDLIIEKISFPVIE